MAPAIPKDSLVLVTGANGYVGSHVVNKFLEAGYRVRGTTRDLKKLQGIIGTWETQYGKDRFEAVVVPDMSVEGAFDASMQGASAVVHVAGDVSFNPDPNLVIPVIVGGIKSVLASAAKTPSIKRFVYTGSSTAVSDSILTGEKHLDSSSWNEEALVKAWNPPPYGPEHANNVYAASKVAAEKALWKFVEEKKPGFVANCVLPGCVWGRFLAPGLNITTGGLLLQLLKGEAVQYPPSNLSWKALKLIIPLGWFVDVEDLGLLHVAAAVEEDVKGERIFGYADKFTWNRVLRALRTIFPDRKIIDDYTDEKVQDVTTVSTERAVELLKRFGQDGWTSLEKSIENTVKGF
ncbi:hypothetical protein HYFRA_00000545 [Hymenoscyphus fraxineus]|uniref:NAD-dependent epimerase/dehydratase domain-containing protein n=1 Tax=Hymenoscyphus fraxineus TaxID=746836 RepID=A0A9N9PWU9_9HELO|nr:hypothetical protein HYFRA_00000545 [Hymenoscyphus fraxineus]